MDKNSLKIGNFKKKLDKESFHVFLISNPIFEVISYLWINELNIPEEKIILISLRSNFAGLFKIKYKYFQKTFFDRFCNKIKIDRYSKKIINWVENKSNNYYVYCARLHSESEKLINQRNCSGHFYIEEGQISYSNKKIFDNLSEKHYLKKKLNKSNYAADKEYQFRNDALLFIGLDKKVFPQAESEKKVVLSDLNLLKKIYNPFLIGQKNIGLIPAPRRLIKVDLDKFLEKFLNIIPDNSYIKFHPGYQYSDSELRKIEYKINSLTKKSFKVCSNKVILEIEMIFEKKILYGSQSSIETYADLFGSEYKSIKIY